MEILDVLTKRSSGTIMSIPELQPGQVAKFAYLHLDTAQHIDTHRQKGGTNIYRIEGKVRPMIVMSIRATRIRGRCWYMVAKVTSKGLCEDGSLKRGFEPIGNCIEEDTESFVQLFLECYPDNLLCYDGNHPDRCEPSDRIAFQYAIRVLQHKLLKKGATTVFKK